MDKHLGRSAQNVMDMIGEDMSVHGALDEDTVNAITVFMASDNTNNKIPNVTFEIDKVMVILNGDDVDSGIVGFLEKSDSMENSIWELKPTKGSRNSDCIDSETMKQISSKLDYLNGKFPNEI